MSITKRLPKGASKPKASEPYLPAMADKARMAVMPSINGAAVIHAYQGNVMGKDADMRVLVTQLRDTFAEVKGGDLHTLEAMLISQATALQTIFTSLARRAQDQQYQKHLEAFLGLALKAQAQSRATISSLVDLKFPRQATFVKQANIANGPQQVNNGAATEARPENGELDRNGRTHAEKSEPQQNKLLEANHGQPGGRMDTREAQTAERSYQAVETVETVHRAKKS